MIFECYLCGDGLKCMKTKILNENNRVKGKNYGGFFRGPP
jgi:hypothetical protein